MVDPSCLCRKHLFGEHVETHMFVGSILKGNSLKGYKNNGLVEVHNLISRHHELAEEISRRGYNHKSPLPKEFIPFTYGEVDVLNSYDELSKRCPDCRERIIKWRLNNEQAIS